jgi:hypothetical protein
MGIFIFGKSGMNQDRTARRVKGLEQTHANPKFHVTVGFVCVCSNHCKVARRACSFEQREVQMMKHDPQHHSFQYFFKRNMIRIF